MSFIRLPWLAAQLLWRAIRLLWWLVRLPWRLARLPRRLLGSRWLRRLLLWWLGRKVRESGWRGTATYLFRQRRHLRTLVVASWRATVGLLRMGRRIVRLIAWVHAHTPRALGQRAQGTLRARVVPGLTAGDRASDRWLSLASQPRTPMSRRVAHRRDVIRRSVLSAVGVDPNWRPARTRSERI
jgi:hypothetical protein